MIFGASLARQRRARSAKKHPESTSPTMLFGYDAKYATITAHLCLAVELGEYQQSNRKPKP